MGRLSRDLQAQARILATREPKKPKQASLRRAVSTAYYSLFHFLIEEATGLLVGASHQRLALRQLAGRAFVHAKMKTLCKEFVKANPNTVHELLRPFWNPLGVGANLDIQTIAQTFIDLQDERHRADYDLASSFSRNDALNAVDRAEAAVLAWRHLKGANAELCQLFSVALSLWPSLAARQ